MIILVDVDGPCADIVQGFLNEVYTVTGRVYTRADVTTWEVTEALALREAEAKAVWRKVSAPGWCQSLRPDPSAIVAIRELAKKHEIVFVTSPMKTSPTWCYDRALWLHRNFGTFPIVFTEQKHLVRGDLLIDDKPSTVRQFLAAGRGAVLFDAPWNREDRHLDSARGTWSSILAEFH